MRDNDVIGCCRDDQQQLVYSKKKNGLGVRKENVIVYCDVNVKKKYKSLEYNKPCVCESLIHRTTKSSECLLNVQYNDN